MFCEATQAEEPRCPLPGGGVRVYIRSPVSDFNVPYDMSYLKQVTNKLPLVKFARQLEGFCSVTPSPTDLTTTQTQHSSQHVLRNPRTLHRAQWLP